jgi:nicotinate-nucleotide--dimethylbenzimidazole phosphoribosyltransferase
MIAEIISSIKPLHAEAMDECQNRIDNLTKPLNSLQGFEQLACQLAGITGNARPQQFKASIILMAGDHGVAAEDVVITGRKTTLQLVEDFCQGMSPIHVFAGHVLVQPVLVDIGITGDLPAAMPIQHEKIAYGTKNIAEGSAMSREEAIQAVEAGIKIAQREIAKGSCVLGIGGIDIDNDVASIATIAAYSPKSLSELTGWNSKTDDGILAMRTRILESVLTVNFPDIHDPWDVLSKVGGFEIAGLAGVILGAAAGRTAVVLDGLLASAAALTAVKLAPQSQNYLIGSHLLPLPAHKCALEMLKLPAYLQLDLGLGQGSGAVLGISLLRASLNMLNDMKTFSEAKVAVAQDGPGALKQKV